MTEGKYDTTNLFQCENRLAKITKKLFVIVDKSNIFTLKLFKRPTRIDMSKKKRNLFKWSYLK